MDDKTVRTIIKNAVTTSLTPIFKAIFDQMKCVNCKKLEQQECSIHTKATNFNIDISKFGCSRFEINEKKFDLPEVDPTEIHIDTLISLFVGHSHRLYLEPQKHVVIFNGYAATEATIELDDDDKMLNIFIPGSQAYPKTIKKMIGLKLIGFEE